MSQIYTYFKNLFPFFITISLWYLATPIFNPVGILCLIPIFYYCFVTPIKNFAFLGGILCFLIDYRLGIPLFWTFMFCLICAINNLQNIINLSMLERNAFIFFVVFIGLSLLILSLSKFTFLNFFNNIWIFLWICLLYLPTTYVLNRVQKWSIQK